MRYTGRFGYVPALPPDGAIRAAATVSDLEKVLPKGKFPGWSGWGEGTGKMHSAVSWALFTFTATNTIETLSVWCDTVYRKGDTEQRIEGLEIRRGIFRQAK